MMANPFQNLHVVHVNRAMQLAALNVFDCMTHFFLILASNTEGLHLKQLMHLTVYSVD